MTKRVEVLVGRKWHKPEITVFVTREEIGVKQSLEDFLKALSIESGIEHSILQKAAEQVVEGMKEETARIM